MYYLRMCRILAFSFLPIACLAAEAQASISVGSLIKFQNGPGSPGGEFGIALAATPSLTEFVTFCVEKNEYIDFSSTFYVDSIASYANLGGAGGGPNDPLDARTAWLYYNFRNGTLAGYVYGALNDYSAGREDSANALQNGVWFIEQEQGSAGVGAAYVAAANAEYLAYTTDDSYSGNMQAAIDSVRIMNLRWGSSTGALAQSQLYLVPEPATLAIWSVLGLVGLVGYRRFRRMGGV